MSEQMNMFDMLGIGTPEIPLEEQKKGRKGWIIDISAILLKENGFKENVICVCTRPVIFNADTKKDKYDKIWQMCETTHGPSLGWMGSCRKIYSRRPSWNECVEYAHSQYKEPASVRYMERDGKWNECWEYEKGYQKGA